MNLIHEANFFAATSIKINRIDSGEKKEVVG